MRRNNRKGQALILFVIAVGVFLLGSLGLAVDASMLYGNRQMAQAAADAAAQAGAMSILGGTNVGTNAFGGATISPCVGTALTPCYYASKNGFMTASDTVKVEFPATVPGVALAGDVTPKAVKVTITRTVPTTFMKVLGVSSGSVTASATAAIVSNNSPVPIVVLQPSISGALSLGGASSIVITGGPPKGIQVNSKSATAVSVGSVDLSAGGPAGTGSDFGVFGGPSAKPGGISLGTGHYDQPSVPLRDPLSSVSPPPKPGAAPAKTPLANGVSGCPPNSITPLPPGKACKLYYPGDYPTGINVKLETAVFSPGIYYIDAGGFSNAANGDIYMCEGCGTGSGTGNTGMLVYLAGGNIDMGANATANMLGSSNTSAYKGILFFVNHNAGNLSHTLGGGGAMSLQGTIYATNTVNTSTYQTLSLGGGSGSGTVIRGEIITDHITMSGNSSITMNLDPNYLLPVDQVALVK